MPALKGRAKFTGRSATLIVIEYGLHGTQVPSRKTAGLVTLRESRVNAAGKLKPDERDLRTFDPQPKQQLH